MVALPPPNVRLPYRANTLATSPSLGRVVAVPPPPRTGIITAIVTEGAFEEAPYEMPPTPGRLARITQKALDSVGRYGV